MAKLLVACHAGCLHASAMVIRPAVARRPSSFRFSHSQFFQSFARLSHGLVFLLEIITCWREILASGRVSPSHQAANRHPTS